MLIATSFIKVLRRPLESAQYVSIKYTERLAEAGIELSVGSVGDSYDNALAHPAQRHLSLAMSERAFLAKVDKRLNKRHAPTLMDRQARCQLHGELLGSLRQRNRPDESTCLGDVNSLVRSAELKSAETLVPSRYQLP